MTNDEWDAARWKEVPGFPSYLVSDKGQIYNIHRNKLLKPYHNQNGVLAVRLFRHMDEGSKGSTRGIWKLVKMVFSEEER